MTDRVTRQRVRTISAGSTFVMASRWPPGCGAGRLGRGHRCRADSEKTDPIGLPLSQPLPVKLVGGVSVEQFKVPVRVKSEGALH